MENFTGFWYVVRQERNFAGEWIHEYDFEHGDWVIAFFPDGNFGEFFRPAGVPPEKIVGTWTFDPATGMVSVAPDTVPGFFRKYVFDKTGTGIYLYRYDDLPHIRLCRDTIAGHHAREKLRLVRP